jgi:hypothetical protein
MLDRGQVSLAFLVMGTKWGCYPMVNQKPILAR